MIGLGDVTGGGQLLPTNTNTLNTTPPAMAPDYYDGAIRAVPRVGASMSESELAALRADQSRICLVAAKASALGLAAAPGLQQQCAAVRAANFAKGVFVIQQTPVDPHYRVQLTAAGEAVIAASPQLAAARAAQPPARRRGFTMGAAVSRGTTDAGFLPFLFAGLDAETRAGFEAATRGGGVRGTSSDDGVSRGAMIAGVAVVGLGVIGAIVYKLRRR